MKYEIKNGPPRAQGKLSAPTPQDSTDNSPSAPETQALSLRRIAPIVWIQPPCISLSSMFDHPDTAAAHLPSSAHHTYAGDDYSPPCLMALPAVCMCVCVIFFFSIHRRQILLIVRGRQGLCSVKLFSLVDYSTWNQLISSLPCKMPAGGISLETSILGFFQENTQPKFTFRCKADPFHCLSEEIKSSCFLFFFSPSLLKMRIMNVHTYVYLPGSLSFRLFVCAFV